MGGGGRFAVRRALVAAVDLALPVRCGGCAGPDGPWCAGCRGSVRAASRSGGRGLVGADHDGAGALAVWSAAVFEGALRPAVSAWKDEGRRDLEPLLAVLLSGALSSALLTDPVLRAARSRDGVVHVVPVPTSPSARRRRGGDPLGDLTRRAVAAVRGPPVPRCPGPVVTPALAHVRRVADQSRLSRTQRRANLHGALAVRPRVAPALHGAAVVLVDDVVTTGATLMEAVRAVRAAGATHVVAVTVAATPRGAAPAPATS